MRRLIARADELKQTARAKATTKAYESDLRIYQSFCHSIHHAFLPTSAETLALFATKQLNSLSPATVERRITAVRAAHGTAGLPIPSAADARKVIQGARREKRRPSKAKSALTVEQLSQIEAHLRENPSAVHERDRALMLFGFATGMRRGELAALDVADVKAVEQGLSVTIRKSKTDQVHRGRSIGIFRAKTKRLCPVSAITRWLRVRGTRAGPLFYSAEKSGELGTRRISGEAINTVAQRCAQAIGLKPASYGAHSLRAGMVTAALESGASESAVMRRTGHKSRETMDRYVRPASQFSSDPLAKAL